MLTSPVSAALPQLPLAAETAVLLAEPIHYAVSATWEESVNGSLTETTVSRHIDLQEASQGGLHQVRLFTQHIVLAEVHTPQPLQNLALQLSALYSELVLNLGPVGEPIALTNYAHIVRMWKALEAELRQGCHAEDTVTQALLQQVEHQLQDPGRVLHSLRHDYVYRALVHTLSRSSAPISSSLAAHSTEFSQFFDGQSIWFSEYLSVKPTESSTQETWTFRGRLDEHRTDMGQLQQRIQAALHPRHLTESTLVTPFPTAASSPGALRCGYEATHTVVAATGLAERVVLTVYCRFAESYNKQYSLTIQRL